MLTELLRKREDVAQALAELVPPRRPLPVLPLQVRPRTANYALVGTAFDYLLRWEIERRNPAAKDQEWVATVAVEKILPTIRDPEVVSTAAPNLPPGAPKMMLGDVYPLVLGQAMKFHEAWVASAIPLRGSSRFTPEQLMSREFARTQEPTTEALETAARHVLTLAKIDPLFRTGKVDPTVNVFEPEDVADIVELFRVVPWEGLGCVAGMVPRLNPSFGSVTARFQGADADLIVEQKRFVNAAAPTVDGANGPFPELVPVGTLIDFKTTKYREIEKHYPQLVGYGCISDLYREECPDFPVIEEAGIYFARHGELEMFDFGAVRSNPKYEATKTMLLQAADEMFGGGNRDEF